jgi:hypothetical protein
MVVAWVQSSGLHVQGPCWSRSMAEVLEVLEMARVCWRGLVRFGICDIHHSRSTCHQDRLGAQWDSCLGISSDKVLSCPSTHFLPRRSLVVSAQPSSWRYDSCWHAGKFLFNWKLSELPPHPRTMSDYVGLCWTTLDHTGLSPLTNSITPLPFVTDTCMLSPTSGATLLTSLGTLKVSFMFRVKTAALPLTHRQIHASSFLGGGELVSCTTRMSLSK